jgi:DNA polymerase III delta prime subunit
MHPDVLIISPDKSIKIDEIRQITDYTRFGPASSKWKIVIIESIDLMSEESANSFLKTLEEPAANILFILTTSRESKILKTIISRCQKLSFFEEEEALDDGVRAAAEELMSIGKMDIPQVLQYSDKLSSSEDLNATLSAAVKLFREKYDAESGRAFLAVKGIFSAIRSLERHANKRLALDNMLLNFKEATNN